jgi:SEC-C motif domain protein
MRSRYCAFVLCNAPYLLSTWHQSTKPASIDFEPKQHWLKLELVRSATSESTAEVEFIARFRIAGGSARRHHEISRFVREDGRWLYVDGEVKQ